MTLDFTAIDFETANEFRGSPCSVGLVKVRDGRVVERVHWLMQPPQAVSRFSPFNTSLHGITADMVVAAPGWSERLPEILDFVNDDILAAHNASFDTGVIRQACDIDGVPWPSLRFVCTLALARRAYALPSYRLPFVLQACGATFEDHHHALADAERVVEVVRALAATDGAQTLEELAASHRIRIGTMGDGGYRGSASTATGNAALVATAPNPNADPDGYLYGRVVVFTGALTSMTRQAAWDAVMQAGGTPEKNTTRRTNVLVIGDSNPVHLTPAAELTGKARKAFQLQDQGQDIELMTEVDFLQVLGGGGLLSGDLQVRTDF